MPVKEIGEYAFIETNIKKVVIPDSITTIGDTAFFCCRSLTSVTIPDSVTSIGNGAFLVCSSLNSVKFNDTTYWYLGTNGSSINVTDDAENAKT